MVKGPRDISAVARYGEPCSRSGIPPGPLPDFTSIYKYFGGLEKIKGYNGMRKRVPVRARARAKERMPGLMKIHLE